MQIGGFQPLTLLDYPQKVAAIIFTSGCNLRCLFCYNPDLVLPELINTSSLFSEKKVLSFLRRRRQYLDGVCLSGGEPTIHSDLPDFCRQLKKMNYLVKVDTNGLLPVMIEKLIAEKLVDYLAMDIKASLENYEHFCGVKIAPENILASIKIIKASGLDYEFRSTLIKGFHAREEIIAMAKLISGAKNYFLQNFEPRGRLVGNHFPGRAFSVQEMADWRALAAGYVECCRLRG